MSLSLRSFKLGLYEEHLDEMAFLRAQGVALRNDPLRGWQDASAFEDRIEAHLDALIVGDTMALDLALARAEEADADELFAIVELLCRRADEPALNRLLQGPALNDADKSDAIAQALITEWPQAWQPVCVRSLAQGDPRLAPTLMAVAACRGWAVGDALVDAWRRATPEQRLALLPSVGRVAGAAPSVAELRAGYAGAQGAAGCSAALRAGLRLHDEQARQQVLSRDDLPELVALAAPRGAAPRLIGQLRGAETDTAVVRALGQLGELSAVRMLTALLSAEPVAATAARALHLITGAELREVVLVPEPVDEDAMNDTELRRWREKGEAPRRADGQPFGDNVDRLSQDPAVWGQWLVDNGARFRAGQRYRLGQPCTPEWMLRSLAHAAAPALGRDALADELITRHGLALTWHPCLPVAAQWAAMRQATPQAQAAAGAPGQWHWAGQQLVD